MDSTGMLTVRSFMEISMLVQRRKRLSDMKPSRTFLTNKESNEQCLTFLPV